MHADSDGTPHLSFNQIAQILPSLLTGNGDFEHSSIYFIHLCIFGKSQLGIENIFDFMLDTKVQLQSL
jgi:hypothetical protein